MQASHRVGKGQTLSLYCASLTILYPEDTAEIQAEELTKKKKTTSGIQKYHIHFKNQTGICHVKYTLTLVR